MAWYHRWTTKVLSRFPWLYRQMATMAAGEVPVDVPRDPWTPFEGDPFDADLMLVTSGGVHTPDQEPFDMQDSRGDASFRWIPRELDDYEITHDYYDHSDADEDLNCLYPLPLLRERLEGQVVGRLVDRHLSFMGHIEDPLLPELVHESLPKAWAELEDRPDLILLSPG